MRIARERLAPRTATQDGDKVSRPGAIGADGHSPDEENGIGAKGPR
jgi:hypothetical protein